MDVDPAVVSMARRKAVSAGAQVRFDLYDGRTLPYPDRTFDRVLTSYVFHHLDDQTKASALREILRVLRAGGELYILDFDRARRRFQRVMFGAVRLLDSRGSTRANARGAVRDMMGAAGLQEVQELARYNLFIGEGTCLRGRRGARGLDRHL